MSTNGVLTQEMFARAYAILNQGQRGVWPILPVPWMWRAYAQWYNARHPHRKVKWTKLSRPQVEQAMDFYKRGIIS